MATSCECSNAAVPCSRATTAWLRAALRRARPQAISLLSLAELLLLVAWMVFDPRFDAIAHRLQRAVGIGAAAEVDLGESSRLQVYAVMLGAWLALIVATNAALLFTLVAGSPRQRTLRAWFVCVTLLCLWTATAIRWPEVTWWGKQYRLQSQVAEFETAAQELRAQWPRDDGELSSGDPYMAYPVGAPATLIMLTLPPTSRAGTSFNVVDRGPSGALRFQLTGREIGDWLEWHPAQEQPSSFVGGLLDPHELEQSWSLGEGWFLVRYRQ